MEQKKPFSIEDKFAEKKWNYGHFNKIMTDISKQAEMPYSKYGFRNKRSYSNLNLNLEELKKARKDLDIPLMRRISNDFYQSNTSYKRIVDFFAYLYTYYYTLDLKGLAEPKNHTADTKKLYFNVLSLLDNMNIAQTFGNISQRVLLNGVYYGYVNVFPQNKVTFTELNPDYCRSINTSAYGTKLVDFNLTFFEQYKSNPADLEMTLANFPEEVRLEWKLFDLGVRSNPWITLPPNFSCAFMLGSSTAPILFDAVIDSINYEEYKDLEKEKDESELEKILVQRFELDDDGDLDVLLEEMAAIHKAVSTMLEKHDSIDVLTTLAKEVDLKDTQAANKSITYTNLNKMLQPKYESSGISTEIFSATGTTSLEKSIENATSFMSQLVEQYQNWLSMFCYGQFSFQKLVPIVTILPVTWYNQKTMLDLYLKNAQYGFSWILPYVASGKKQSTITDSIALEQDLLGLKDKMRPLSSSFTETENSESGNSTGKVGRPELPDSEKSAKTIANIESM